MNIFGVLKERGFDTVPAAFYSLIKAWRSWYEGDVKDFHRYRVFNGQNYVRCRRYSAGMGKQVSASWGGLLLNEKVSIAIDSEKEQQFFDDVYRRNNAAVKLNEMQELKSALGTTAYVPRVVGLQVDPASGRVVGRAEAIKIDYCTADNIYPLTWENGVVDECAFTTRTIYGGDKYLYLQIHRREPSGEFVIENSLYLERGGNLKEVELSSIASYSNIPAVVHTGTAERQFVIDRLNLVNGVDESLPMGVSVFAGAIDQLKGVDTAYDSYVNEFVLGKKRIMVKPEATQDLNGDPVFDANDTVYYVLPEDSQNGSVIEQIDMSLRTAEHSTGIQDMLNMLSSKCGLGENYFKFDRGSITTATQIVSEHSVMFRTLKRHEIILESVLKELVRIVLRLGKTYIDAGLNPDAAVTIQFDDSIIEDTRTDTQDMRADVAAGLIRPELYVMKKYGVSEEDALKMMPGMEEMTTEKQDEVE